MWSNLASRVAHIFSTFESLHIFQDSDCLDCLDCLVFLHVSFHDKPMCKLLVSTSTETWCQLKLHCAPLCTPTGWSKFDRCQPCHKSSRLHRAPCKYSKGDRCFADSWAFIRSGEKLSIRSDVRSVRAYVPSLQAVDQEKTHLVSAICQISMQDLQCAMDLKKNENPKPSPSPASRNSRTRAGSKLTFRRPLLC